ncbi:hypothetical protein A4X13_0g7492 [Tilletia indica]|uniref:DUF659 domain-containing protein n=1 Tax=Tilletia indica TaxID=43049 RepID=A0A177T8Y2_9BASI|nr:hypothetical protein A4X13_0g7492 [Tilletia indica]
MSDKGDKDGPARSYGLRDPASIKRPKRPGELPSKTAAPASLPSSTPEPTPSTSNPPPVFSVPANKALLPRTGPSNSVSSSSTVSRPKPQPLKPGQPDRNLDLFLPRTVRVERAVEESESEEELSPGRIQRDIQKAAQVGKKGKNKVSAGAGSKPASGARSESDSSQFDDPTDEDDAIPTSAQKPKKTPSKSISIDLTADSQEYSDNSHPNKSPSKSVSSSTKAASSKSSKNDKVTKESTKQRSRKEISPEKALAAAKRAWTTAHTTAAQEALEESNGGKIGKRTPSNAYLYFKEPVIADHPTNSSKGQGIGFWCTGCCAESQLVWRPLSDSSTSNLRAHTSTRASLSNRVNLGNAGKTGPLDAYMIKKAPPSSADAHITATEARQIAVEWITSSSRPLSIIEDPGFSKLLSPALREIMPGRKVVADDVIRIYSGMLDVIKERLASVTGCFHLALDVWTSKNGNAFLAITVNYQQEGEAKRHLLNMLPFLASHDAKNMSKAVYQSIERAGITDRVWCIVADNASENSAMLPLLSGMGGMPRFRGKASQVRCMAHVCNLVSKAVANTFIKAASSVRVKQKDAIPEESSEDEEDDMAIEEDDSEEDGDANAEETEDRNDNAEADAEYEDVLDEPDDAISCALNPELVADDEDEAELREILAGPIHRPRRLDTPASSGTVPSSSAPSLTQGAAAAEEEEQELRNGEVGLQIKKLAWLSKKIHYSPSARRSWKQECRRHNLRKPWTLLRDVATRWDSTQKMIERGVKLWKAIISFSENNPKIVEEKHRLRRADKSTFDNLLAILTPMAKATSRFSKKTKPMIGEVVGMFERLDTIFATIEIRDGHEATTGLAKRCGAWQKGGVEVLRSLGTDGSVQSGCPYVSHVCA